MKTIAVIAEFNPFHNGHAFLLAEARRQAGADAVIVIMSGDYVQRGEPAILDKFTRAEMALLCGADLVLELPAACAAAGAGRFAFGAVRTLDALGCVDELWFGSECGRILPFQETSAILSEEPAVYTAALQSCLSRGLTYPAAREEALRQITGRALTDIDVLSGPNNTLGLEYCIALSRLGSRIRPQTLPRRGNGYHVLSLDSEMASAAAIREYLLRARARADTDTDRSASWESLSETMPPACIPIMRRALQDAIPLCADDFSEMLHYQLLKETEESLAEHLDMPADLAARICSLLPQYRCWTQFAALLKTRNFTRTQIDRALLHVLLGIRPADTDRALRRSFARMLGFRREAAPLLTEIKKAGSLTLAAGAADLAGTADYTLDLFASNLYEARRAALTGQPFVHEFSREILRV